MLYDLTMHYMDSLAINDDAAARVALDKICDECGKRGLNIRDYLASARLVRAAREMQARRVAA